MQLSGNYPWLEYIYTLGLEVKYTTSLGMIHHRIKSKLDDPFRNGATWFCSNSR